MSKKTQGKRRSPVSASSSGSACAAHIEESRARAKRQIGKSAITQWRGMYSLVPGALAFLTSMNTLWNGFAADDLYQVLQNTFIRKLSNIPFAFTRSVWAFVTEDIVFSVDQYYRPLFSVLFAINYALFGSKAWGWHLVNILVHTSVALLVFIVIRELTEMNWVALISASLFAVHPTHAESVAWVSGVTDPMMSVFMLTAFYLYVRYRKGGSKYLLVLMLPCYLAALLCKETAISLPVIVAYCELLCFTRSVSLKQRILRSLTMAGLFLVPTTVALLMRYGALGRLLGEARALPLSVGLATIPLATVKYLWLMLVPAGYSYQHETPFVFTIKGAELLGPLAIIVALGCAIAMIRSRLLTFAAIWFMATLAPALFTIRQFDPEYVVQERYLYLPSIGFCLAIALAMEWVIRRSLFGSRTAGIVVLASLAIAVVWSLVYVKQNRVWDNDIALYKNVVAVYPHQVSAHVALARAYHLAGRVREADLEARAALDLNPTDSQVYVIMSFFANTAGKYKTAIEYLERAAEMAHYKPRARNELGTIYLNIGLIQWQLKDYERAEESFLRSVDIWPRAAGWYHLGRFYFDWGRFEQALTMFELTAKSVPQTYPPIHLHLGRVYDLLGNKDEARTEYEEFLEVAPPDAANRTEVAARLQNL